MITLLKQIRKDTFIYGIGGVITAVFHLLVLPIYTRFLSPAEYGIIEAMLIINAFFAIFVNIGMDMVQSYYFFEQKKSGLEQQKKVITSIFQWRLTFGFTAVIAATFIAPILPLWFLGSTSNWPLFFIAFSGVWLSQLVSQCAEIFRLLYKPWPYLAITISHSIGSALIIIGLVVWAQMGVLGYFIGLSISALTVALISWSAARNYIDWSKLHFEWWPHFLRFGVPLIPGAIAMYVLNSSDRLFIAHFHGKEELGFYAVGNKLALGLLLFVEPFRKAWWPIAMDALHKTEGPTLIAFISRAYLAVGAALVVSLTAFSPILAKWFLAPQYFEAYLIIGILAWKTLFFGYFMICSLGIWKEKKTDLIPLLHIAAAVSNVILNFLLIPKYAGMGAALGTSASFLIWIILTLIVNQKYLHIDFSWSTMGFQIFGGFIATGVLLFFFQNDAGIFKISIFTGISIFLLIISAAKFSHFQKIQF